MQKRKVHIRANKSIIGPKWNMFKFKDKWALLNQFRKNSFSFFIHRWVEITFEYIFRILWVPWETNAFAPLLIAVTKERLSMKRDSVEQLCLRVKPQRKAMNNHQVNQVLVIWGNNQTSFQSTFNLTLSKTKVQAMRLTESKRKWFT